MDKDVMSVEHLSLDAIVSFVDGELPRRAEHRVKVHLVHCSSCRALVRDQREAAVRLRDQDVDVHVSGTLLQRLVQIPIECHEEESSGGSGSMRVDGCRRPEKLSDQVDLMIRKLQRKSR